MASKFDKGETIICWRNVKDENGNYVSPSTSMQITIIDPNGQEDVKDADMTEDSDGHYHYDYHSKADGPTGDYVAIYTATDGLRITIEKNKFGLE